MFPQKAKGWSETEAAKFIEQEIKAFVQTSPLNQIPTMDNQTIYEAPLVQFADSDDPLFAEYKTVVDPYHLTPREALAKALKKSPEDMPARLSIISWVLPFTSRIREANRQHTQTPSRFWLNAYWYGEKFNRAVRGHVVKLLTEMGYLAVAPVLQPYFKMELTREKGYYSNWSERHIAYAAGLGTFSLSDGFITERGIAHRCGSAITNLILPVSPRTAKDPYSNCLFYINGKCRACIARCPAEAITEKGHDKRKCQEYIKAEFHQLLRELTAEEESCGLCQTRVPCEFRNPTKKLKKRTG
jgi:epoxyqueuosine reductase QueG